MRGALRRAGLAVVLLVALLVPSGCGGAPSHARQGNRLYEDQEYAQALVEYQLAQAELPEQPELHYNVGNTLHRLGDYTSAISETMKIGPSATDDLQQAASYNLGNSFYRSDEYTQAIAMYKQALRLNPDDIDAKHNLELALQKLTAQRQREQEQAQQQGQQGEQDREDQQPPPEGGGSAEPTPTPEEPEHHETPAPSATPTAGGEGQEGDSAGGTPTPQPSGLTPEQAMQLLESLAQDERSLHEIISQLRAPPDQGVDRDW